MGRQNHSQTKKLQYRFDQLARDPLLLAAYKLRKPLDGAPTQEFILCKHAIFLPLEGSYGALA